MGRWWTGYTSISAGRLGIAHSHGEPWLFAATERLQPAYGYGLWKAKIPSEKMCSIAVCGGAGCESFQHVQSDSTTRLEWSSPATGWNGQSGRGRRECPTGSRLSTSAVRATHLRQTFDTVCLMLSRTAWVLPGPP